MTHGKMTLVKPLAVQVSQALKTELLRKLQARCTRRSREVKELMLDGLCEGYRYERKDASRLLDDGMPAPEWAVATRCSAPVRADRAGGARNPG